MRMVPTAKPCTRLLVRLLVLCYSIHVLCFQCQASDSANGGRYSFSLTTFDPSGKLGQVERATRAASLGTPVVAAICRHDQSNAIFLACPQALPSPLMIDDGTARFCRITHNIACTHSGLGADGRVVLAAAQRMAVEHAYTFDETIPIEIFLEELSLMFQEYTMKAGSRPFGCTVLVAHVPSEEDIALGGDESPQLYRIDPSGAVESLGTYAVIGSLQSPDLLQKLEAFTKQSVGDADKAEESLLDVIYEAMTELAKKEKGSREVIRMPFLTASLTRTEGLAVRRHDDYNFKKDTPSTL